jgi:hypothetical protein
MLITTDVKMLSRKVPFYQYSQVSEIRSALSRGELPARIVSPDDSADEIDNKSWDLITRCCALEPDDRPTLSDIWKWLASWGIQDNRPPAKPFPGVEILKSRRTFFGVDLGRAGEVLARIIVGHHQYFQFQVDIHDFVVSASADYPGRGGGG